VSETYSEKLAYLQKRDGRSIYPKVKRKKNAKGEKGKLKNPKSQSQKHNSTTKDSFAASFAQKKKKRRCEVNGQNEKQQRKNKKEKEKGKEKIKKEKNEHINK
jgi:hypothetical protein